ncbi:MAG: hypothetical protein O2999_11370 [Nitrospirae bacterium]|nr:hypothetical protein [Nitrospirota bacterium]MDA1304879.1 hypothetical protein [Nitrospirota bacterium]
MNQTVHVKTTILPGGKIEITDPNLPPGESVEVVVFLPEHGKPNGQSAVDVLSQAPGHRLFKTSDEVDSYIHGERGSWDR